MSFLNSSTLPNASLAERLARLPQDARANLLAQYSDDEVAQFEYDWSFWGRPSQQPPEGNWRVWMLLAGRGFGKTRTGAEWIKARVKAGARRIALVAPTASDVRDTMVEGETGILSVYPDNERPNYEPSKRRIVWPNGAMASTFSADQPERLRGPQHDCVWCFCAGTMVHAQYGQEPIENIEVGDFVWTRLGLRRVLSTGSRLAEVGRVDFSNGQFLFGTADHPILSSHGWMRMSDLHEGMDVCAISALNGMDGSGIDTESPITSVVRKAAQNVYTLRSIVSIMGIFRRVTTFIIKMTMLPTMIPEISNAYPIANTAVVTLSSSAKLLPTTEITQNSTHPALIAARHCVANFIRRLRSVENAGINALINAGRRKERAGTAVRYLCPLMDTSAVSVVSTWEPATTARVYNLRVADTPEYFANGILVHNCDELAAWRYPAAWDMLMFGLRLGDDPRAVVTTTPRPTGLIRALIKDPNTVITRGSSYENRVNLAPAFFTQITRKYEGTRLGRQELEAELLEDTPGALWSYETLDATRWPQGRSLPDLARIVVAIDPAATSGEYADDTGIVVAGKDIEGHAYVLAESSGQMSPQEWAKAAIAAYRSHRADRIVAERNNGGEMVAHTIRAVWPEAPVTEVWASRGKVTRAEPVAALYEQGRVHHCGVFAALEDQMTSFTIDFDRKEAGYSPDRVDALVWAITDLLVDPAPQMWVPAQVKVVA